MIDLSLILTCYNEEHILVHSFSIICRVLDFSRLNYEIIFVDDGSKDDSQRVIKQIIKNNPRLKIKKFFNKKNQGRGKAVVNGLRLAKGEVAGYIDTDLELSPIFIPSFVQKVLEGIDIINAYRYYTFSLPRLYRVIFSVGYIKLTELILGHYFGDTVSGFKFFRRKKILPLLDKIKSKHWFWDTEFLVRANIAGLSICELPVLYLKNPQKQSSVDLLKDTFDYFKKLFWLRGVIKRENPSNKFSPVKLLTQHSC